MADWFYGKDGTQHGPVSDPEIHTLINSGQIDAKTIVWCEGMPDWAPVNAVPEFQHAFASSGSAGIPAQPAPSSRPSTNPYGSPQSYAGQAPYAGSPIPTDGLSIAALVCGILAIVACYVWALFGIPAVICGHMSLKKIKHSVVPIQGKGMAIAGLVCGYLGIAFQLFMIIAIALAFADMSRHSY
ncbi:DUF4339 domain-containing protein [Verrucomicrobiaceae bacterium N1E253]|uniref:DUF4339 domain-containing protein n=1 Tax=Oceaniferula marina TaxID=2748318 RepID=A0A851GGC5_9BACT|nr:GYF domain-containing protein [Oceaniferula marina]NWK56838.1 DUF4339 domain-containing protein [Oceaniferula marina]